jgi:NitT/TauT family transport system substrate-binding protein
MGKISRARVLAGTAAALVAAPRFVVAQTLEKVRFGGVITDDITPVYYAMKNGLYAKAGIDLEIVATSSGSAATTAVVAGAYEMGKGSLIASLIAHLRGLPLTVVANASIWDPKVPFNQMLVAADSTYKTGADLNGKIGAAAGLNDLNQLAMSAWVDKTGGDSKSLKWVEIPNSASGASVAEHRVDFCALQEPVLTAELETKKVRAIASCYSAISEHFVFGAFFANADWAAKHAELVKRWVRITLEAAAYTNTHHAETVPMMAEATKIPLAVMQKIARVDSATPSSADPSLMQPLIEVAARYKSIPRSFPAKDLFFKG